MVEKKLQAVRDTVESEVEASAARVELEAQIAELRAEIARLTDSVSAIGSGARADFDASDRCRRFLPVWTVVQALAIPVPPEAVTPDTVFCFSGGHTPTG